MVARRRRRPRRAGYDVLVLPHDGRSARRLRVSPVLKGLFFAAVLGNVVLMAALFWVSGHQQTRLQENAQHIAALMHTRDQLLRQNQEQAVRLHDFAVKSEQLTERLRELEQLSDEVWTLLGENPAELEPPLDVVAGRGGPDGDGADIIRRTSLNFGSLASQMPLHLRELESLRDLVVARNHRLDHTPSIWPVQGYVSSEYGTRKHPISGVHQRHDGIDIAAPRGTTVRAPAAGRVAFAGDRGGYGLTVVLDHGYGVQTLYAHNSKLLVRVGQRVERGDALAQVGTTGVSTGPHLHYEVIVNGEPVNPRMFLP